MVGCVRPLSRFIDRVFLSLASTSGDIAAPLPGVRTEFLHTRQVGDRARQPQDEADRPRRQIELSHRGADQALTFLRKFAELPYFPHAHIGFTDDIGYFVIRTSSIRISLCLNISRRLHPCTDTLRWLSHPVSAQLFVIYAWHFDVNIDTVAQWTRDSLLVFGNNSRPTRTRFLCI